MEQEPVKSFDWSRILLPEEFNYDFLLEVAFRTAFMFLLLLIFLKLSGKRSIFQLSLFEIALIVGLGSAAGDPMFYHDVGLLPILVVFIVIAFLYKGVVYITAKSEKMEKIIEGRVESLLDNNILEYKRLDSEAISSEEFFGFLRALHIEHLGQVRNAYLELTGNISVYFYSDEEVRPGLPILPDSLDKACHVIPVTGYYSCQRCGFTEFVHQDTSPVCSICNHDTWIRSMTSTRIT